MSICKSLSSLPLSKSFVFFFFSFLTVKLNQMLLTQTKIKRERKYWTQLLPGKGSFPLTAATCTGLNAWGPLWTIKLISLGWKTWCDYLPLHARVFQSIHNAAGLLGGKGGVKSRFIPLSRCVSHYRKSSEYRTCRTVYIPWENHEKGRVFRSKKRMNECFGHLACCHAPSRAVFFVST